MGKREIGNKGEDLAVEFLKKENYKILERNFQTRFGEIDIIAEKNNELIIIEVKTRRTDYFGQPAEFVTPQKQAKIRKTAFEYLNAHPYRNWRIDVISIISYPKTQIKHYENITS